MEFHEIANIFPLIEGDEFRELVEDVKEHGLREPIVLADGKIVDGRNRYRACLEARVQPIYVEWDGKGTLLSYVVSLNIKRRHLTTSQRAALAYDVLPRYEAEARKRQAVRSDDFTSQNNLISKGNASGQAAEEFGTNQQYVLDVKKLQKDYPELVEQIRAGLMSVPEAKQIAKDEWEKEKKDQEQKAEQERLRLWNEREEKHTEAVGKLQKELNKALMKDEREKLEKEIKRQKDEWEKEKDDHALEIINERQLQHARHIRMLWASSTSGLEGVLREFVGTSPSIEDLQLLEASDWHRFGSLEKAMQAALETINRIKRARYVIDSTVEQGEQIDNDLGIIDEVRVVDAL